MLSKLMLSDEVKASYDPITHFLKMQQLSMSLSATLDSHMEIS